ncbi:HD domain-containing protein [Streptomyces aureocirculatus]|uniref:HD domain-containing protein n=1 Tax=Streptomyces aureocirculatus TaxID=67275 RepID=UPI00068DA7C0|nr:HD domain-containing protein [Streptomyces aureocirculatus]
MTDGPDFSTLRLPGSGDGGDHEGRSSPERLRKGLDFLVEAHRLTGIHRLNRLLDGTRGESSAEHSWHLALMAMVLGEALAPDVDLARVAAMLTLHDLVEIEAGDVPIYLDDERAAAREREAVAAERLYGRLPGDQGGQLRGLWQEFEDAATPEARFARAVDRFQPVLMHWAAGGQVWRERGVSTAEERRVTGSIRTFWPELWPLTEALIEDARRRGMLSDPGVPSD